MQDLFRVAIIVAMTTHHPNQIRALIERLARLSEAEDWAGELNPAQMAALSYLANANRFSRAPSHVASFSGSTRGTVSQTLRALERKGLVTETRSQNDRRSISYSITAEGRDLALSGKALDKAIASLPPDRAQALEQGLGDVLRTLLAEQGGRSFGLCRRCRHHEPRGTAGFCHLLKVDLEPAETEQICHEHEPA